MVVMNRSDAMIHGKKVIKNITMCLKRSAREGKGDVKNWQFNFFMEVKTTDGEQSKLPGYQFFDFYLNHIWF